MTRVVIETAALADAIKKAERVAPAAAGQAFDKAAGIMLEVATSMILVKATNLDVYSIEWVEALEIDGEETRWRLPSKIFAMVCASLPIGSGKTVTLKEEKGEHYSKVSLQSGKTKARFNLLSDEYYPQWSAFDPDTLEPVADLGGRLTQVEWAADKSNEPLNGVNLDGSWAFATDRYRMARVPLKIPTIAARGGSVTIPATILSSLLKQSGEVSLGHGGNQLYIMPDEHSQIRTIIFGLEYPNAKSALDRMNLTDSIKLRKSQLLEIMQRATTFAGADRFPAMKCFIGKEQFAVMMTNDEVGHLGDVLELPGQATHDRVTVIFTPKNIMEPIDKSPSEEIELCYNSTDPKSAWRVDGGSGYAAWSMPRQDLSRG
jgi:DNA polymerase III sliding clamp (beta) subunit (PCNA family)